MAGPTLLTNKNPNGDWTGALDSVARPVSNTGRDSVGQHGVLNPKGDDFLGLGTLGRALFGDAGKIPMVAPGEVRDVGPRQYTSPLTGADSTRALQGQIVNATNGGAQIAPASRDMIDNYGADEYQARAGQMLGVQNAQAAMMGQTPSVAAAQQAQGLDAAIRSQAALANSARGTPAARAAAMRGAGTNVASMQQQAVNSAAALRAGEMAQARGQFMDGIGQMRAGDAGAVAREIGLAQSDAGNQVTTLGMNQENTRGLLGLGLQSDQVAEEARQFGVTTQQADDRLRLDRDLGILGNNTQRVSGDSAAAIATRGGTQGFVSGLLGSIF